MVTREQYEEARKQHDEAEKVIQSWHAEEAERRESRWQEYLTGKRFFTDDELRYARDLLCPCGHGMAYPKESRLNGAWECSAALKGLSPAHSEPLPFAFYDVKSEEQGDGKQTTRGVFRPRKA